MNEKLRWFGMYLGCEFIAKRVGARHTLNASRLANLFTPNYESYTDTCRLILKEINNITEDDLNELNEIAKSIHGECYFDNGLILPSQLFHYSEIDFLRSKGYAIGIPKEYYITEEELKNI